MINDLHNYIYAHAKLNFKFIVIINWVSDFLGENYNKLYTFYIINFSPNISIELPSNDAILNDALTKPLSLVILNYLNTSFLSISEPLPSSSILY